MDCTLTVCKYYVHYTLERPDPIHNISVQSLGTRWVLIEWSIPYNGNSEIMGFIVYIRNVQSGSNFTCTVSVSSDSIRKRQIMSSPTIIHNFTEYILPAMAYQFIIVACNELGCGELGQLFSTILTDEERKHNLN